MALFDCIDHEALLKKLGTTPLLRRQIKDWLKAGVIDDKHVFPTTEGTPQGGVISPLLANIALHGMEERVKDFVETCDLLRSNGRHQLQRSHKRRSVSVIRYADDFVILHENLTVVQGCREIISEWLMGIGLELKPSKTRLTHSLTPHGEEKPGFNFLGVNIRQHPVGKYTTGKNGHGKLLGFKTILTPSKEKVKIHWERLVEVIDTHKAVSQSVLINTLNPIIRGWANYHQTVSSTKTFSKLDCYVFRKLQNWAKNRHSNKGAKWINAKYWRTWGGDNWVFATKEEDNPFRLQKHSGIKKKDYVKVKGESSPYDGNLVYWSTRMGEHPEMPYKTASLLKKQKGKCTHCGLYFKDGDVWEIDHVIPKSQGGRDTKENRQLLHRHCHDNKTASDGSYGKKSGCNSAKPKPFLDPNWIWIEDILVMGSA